MPAGKCFRADAAFLDFEKRLHALLPAHCCMPLHIVPPPSSLVRRRGGHGGTTCQQRHRRGTGPAQSHPCTCMAQPISARTANLLSRPLHARRERHTQHYGSEWSDLLVCAQNVYDASTVIPARPFHNSAKHATHTEETLHAYLRTLLHTVANFAKPIGLSVVELLNATQPTPPCTFLASLYTLYYPRFYSTHSICGLRGTHCLQQTRSCTLVQTSTAHSYSRSQSTASTPYSRAARTSGRGPNQGWPIASARSSSLSQPKNCCDGDGCFSPSESAPAAPPFAV